MLKETGFTKKMSDQLFARLYLDECLPHLLVTMLQKEGWTTTSAILEGQSGKNDLAQLAEATSRSCVLVTSDKTTFLAEAGNVEHCGIIIIAHSISRDEVSKITQKISVLLNQYTADEFHNTVLFVSIKD